MEKPRISINDIAIVGVMVAIIEVCKVCLLFLPNVELTSFWLIMSGIHFGKKSAFIVPCFILIEGMLYGFGLWWIMYLYAWPILVFVAYVFRKKNSPLLFSIISGAFGLSFGLLCSIPYFFIGAIDGGIRSGIYTAFTWWVAGIPFDIIHCIGNFILMFILYKPIGQIMKKVVNQQTGGSL